MTPELLSLCKRFIENRDVIKAAFPMESSYMYPVCASVFANKETVADVDHLKKCHLLLKKSVGVFSNFRGVSRPVTVSMLAADDEPEARLENALKAYTSLKKHFMSGYYLPLAAMILSGEASADLFDGITARTREIYDLMRKEHPFLTSEEDIVYAMLFALSDGRSVDFITEMERIYKISKVKFHSANAVQALSHVLALCDGNADEKCERTAALFDDLKENKLRYGTNYELATLGVLAMLPASKDEIVKDMLEVSEFLSSQKGYRAFLGFAKSIRLMHAAMIVSAYRLGDLVNTAHATAAVSAQMAVAAQQTALIAAQNAALCATIAAQSANHS